MEIFEIFVNFFWIFCELFQQPKYTCFIKYLCVLLLFFICAATLIPNRNQSSSAFFGSKLGFPRAYRHTSVRKYPYGGTPSVPVWRTALLFCSGGLCYYLIVYFLMATQATAIQAYRSLYNILEVEAYIIKDTIYYKDYPLPPFLIHFLETKNRSLFGVLM